MSELREYVKKLEQATEQVQTEALLLIVQRHKNQLIDLNQLQLFSGRNAQGQVLGEYRSASYAAFKNRLNPQPGLGVWDLKLSGDLYAGMYIEADNFPIIVTSSDSKATKFIDADAFGLDEKSLEEFRGEILPDVKEYYKQILSV